MKLTELLKTINPGDKVYRINKSSDIDGYTYLGQHPKKYEYHYFISDKDATKAIGVYVSSDYNDWEKDYFKAKELFKDSMIAYFNNINAVYFKNSLKITNINES